MTEGTDVLPVVLYSVFSVLILFSNSTVIIVIIRSRQLHLPTLWNIAFMAAWDLALGLHFLVFVVPSKILNAFVYPDVYGKVASKLLMFIITQNIINTIIALVDRYISICWPLHYLRMMSAKRFTCAVSSGFLINILRLCLLLTKDNDGVYNKALGQFISPDQNTGMSVSGGFAFVAVSFIIGLLVGIRLKLRSTRTNIGRQQVMSTQFTYTMYLSTVVYILCYMPSAITLLVNIITNERSDVMLQIGMSCILSNSLWNVFIYASTYRPFRDAFLKLFCSKYFRERERRDIMVQFHKNRISVITLGQRY